MEANETPQLLLTEREMEVLRLVATGATNQQIALDLFISANTVKVHLRNIFQKLGVESRTEATMYAVREGWVVLEGVPAPQELEEGQPALPQERISRWQRVFFVVMATLISALVLIRPAGTASNNANSPFTDQGDAVLGPASDLTSSRWESRAQMPTARARLAVVAYDGKVYAIGGDGTEGVSGAVELYDPETDAWTRRASKPVPVRNIGAAVLEDLIYVPGGYDALDQAVDVVEVYDPHADTWHEVAPLPRPLFAYAIAAVRGKLYLFGGSDGMRYLDTVLIYDPASDTWTPGSSMSTARGFCAAAVVGEWVYVLGGYDGQSESVLCEAYDPAKEGSGEGPWVPLAPMRSGRGGIAAVPVDNYVYAIGGGWTKYLAYNERYDVNQDEWTEFESPLLGQWRTLGAAATDSGAETLIHVVGGWSARYLSTNYAYKAVFRIFLSSPR